MSKKVLNPLPSQEELCRRFVYCPDTGDLYWKIQPKAGGRKIGDIAGWSEGSGRRVSFDGKSLEVPRVIWKMLYGTDPIEIDHRDRNRSNNRNENLRDSTTSQNNCNKKVSPLNKLGVKGISKRYKTYNVRIKVNGVGIKVGRFETLEAAKAAYAAASAKYHGEFGRTE